MTATTISRPTAPAHTFTANDLATKREVAGAYLRNRSPQLMLATLAVVLVARLLTGGWGIADLIVVGVVILINGTFEWMVHRFLLHAPDGSIRMRVLGTSVGHRKHHLDPADMRHLMLRPIEVVQFVPMLAAIAAAASLPLLWITGSPMLAPYLTALVAAYIGLAHYEWTHLLVHARYRPTSRYYARLSRNHRLHHHRNENYWLAAQHRSAVPRSRGFNSYLRADRVRHPLSTLDDTDSLLH